MTKEQQAVLELVRIGAGGGGCVMRFGGDCVALLADADWDALMRLVSAQGVVSLCMNALQVLHGQGIDFFPKKHKLQLFARSKHVEQQLAEKNALIEDFVQRLHPLRVAALKGVDYARLWPKSEWREFGDLDVVLVEGLALAIDRSRQIDKRASENGCRVEDDLYKHSHIYYKKLMVENHHCFTSFGGSRQARALETKLRRLFDVSPCRESVSGVLFPNNEFTAVFMLAHAQNHFFLEGITLRHILDWYFFLQQEGGNVNWPLVVDALEETGLTSFAIVLTRLCTTHLGLSVDGLPQLKHFVDMHESAKRIRYNMLDKLLEDVFAEKMSDADRRWHAMILRMCKRFVRNIRFRQLNKSTIATSIWQWMAYSSVFDRRPELTNKE